MGGGGLCIGVLKVQSTSGLAPLPAACCRHAARSPMEPAAYERWLRLVLVVAAEVHTALKQLALTPGAQPLMHRDVKPGNVLAFAPQPGGHHAGGSEHMLKVRLGLGVVRRGRRRRVKRVRCKVQHIGSACRQLTRPIVPCCMAADGL